MADSLQIRINGREVTVAADEILAAAIARVTPAFRRSVRGQTRGPLCGMGVCYECRVTVDGVPHQRACMTRCRQGMVVETGDA